MTFHSQKNYLSGDSKKLGISTITLLLQENFGVENSVENVNKFFEILMQIMIMVNKNHSKPSLF